LNHYCLNREETASVLRVIELHDDSFLEETVKNVWDSSKCYDLQLSVLTYFVCHVLESLQKNGKIDVSALLDGLYTLRDKMFLAIQELDLGFLELMFSHPRQDYHDLADALVQLQSSLVDYQYGKALRR
jgi:hypothetical protein